MRLATVEAEAGWILVMMPLAEPPLSSSHSPNCTKLGSEQPGCLRAAGLSVESWDVNFGFLIPGLGLLLSENSQQLLCKRLGKF